MTDELEINGAIKSHFIFTIIFCLIFLIPQFIGSIPGLPEFARMSDFSSAAALSLYIFIRSLVQIPFSRAEVWLIAFIFGSLVVSVGAVVVFSLLPKYSLKLDIEHALFPIRHLFLFSPALIAFIFVPNKFVFQKLGLTVAFVSVLFILFMSYMYSIGINKYDAHQGLSINEINRGFYFKRMGGIPGESGAYAFHAFFVWAFFLFFVFLNRMWFIGYFLLASTPAWSLLIFTTSQSRIIVLTTIAFLISTLFDRSLFKRRNGILIALFIGSLLLGTFGALEIFDIEIPINRYVLMRFEGILAGNFEASQLSSGRVDNWIEVLGYWLYNPLLGYGYRNAGSLLDVPAENFFVQGLAEYGIIVFGILCVFLFKIWKLLRAASPGNVPNSVAASGGILRAFMVAAFVQWQVNDINTYWQTFPMMLALCVLFARHAMEERFQSRGEPNVSASSRNHFGSGRHATAQIRP